MASDEGSAPDRLRKQAGRNARAGSPRAAPGAGGGGEEGAAAAGARARNPAERSAGRQERLTCFPRHPEETEMPTCAFKETTFVKNRATRGRHFPFYYSK